MPQVDRVVGNADKADPAVLVGDARLAVGDIFQAPVPRRAAAGAPDGRARGYVEIQNGCDHRCTFCLIPFGRGNSRSIPSDIVVSRVRDLAKSGLAEVVLTGVDLTSWGLGLPGEPSWATWSAACCARFRTCRVYVSPPSTPRRSIPS